MAAGNPGVVAGVESDTYSLKRALGRATGVYIAGSDGFDPLVRLGLLRTPVHGRCST